MARIRHSTNVIALIVIVLCMLLFVVGSGQTCAKFGFSVTT